MHENCDNNEPSNRTKYTYDAAGNMTSDGFHSYTYDAEGNVIAVGTGGATGQYTYNALNQRVQTVAGGLTSWFVFNSAGQRVSISNGSTHAQLQGQYYWGGKPVAFYSGGATHYQHQNWMGTERVQTSYNAGTVGLSGIEGVYGSLPFGDNKTSSGTNTDAYHYAGLDNDTESYTDHAQYRQYNATPGRWMSPDPYSGATIPAIRRA